MVLTSSRFNKIVGSDRIEMEDIKEQSGLTKEALVFCREEKPDNEFISSINGQFIVKGSLSPGQLQGLINTYNKLVKD